MIFYRRTLCVRSPHQSDRSRPWATFSCRPAGVGVPAPAGASTSLGNEAGTQVKQRPSRPRSGPRRWRLHYWRRCWRLAIYWQTDQRPPRRARAELRLICWPTYCGQAPDDLTRLARTYVVTGEARYEQQYWDILAIPQWRKPMPRRITAFRPLTKPLDACRLGPIWQMKRKSSAEACCCHWYRPLVLYKAGGFFCRAQWHSVHVLGIPGKTCQTELWQRDDHAGDPGLV